MSVVQTIGRPAVQVSSPNETDHRRQLAQAINRLNQGHSNTTLTVALDAGQTETVVTDSRISPQTCVSLHPQTANAAAALPTTYVVCTKGLMAIHHTDNAETDRIYTVGIVG